MSPRIVIKSNNLAARTPCACCGIVDHPSVPLAAFYEGTWDWVCPECVAREWDLPTAPRLLSIASDALYLALRGDDLAAIRAAVDAAAAPACP